MDWSFRDLPQTKVPTVCVTISGSTGGFYRHHVTSMEPDGNGLHIPIIHTVPPNHHGIVSSILHEHIVDAGAPSTVKGHAHSHSWCSETCHAVSSPSQRRRWQPNVPLLKSACVETLKSFIQKAATFRACVRAKNFYIKTIVHLSVSHWDQSNRDIYLTHISRWIVEVVKTVYQLSDG